MTQGESDCRASREAIQIDVREKEIDKQIGVFHREIIGVMSITDLILFRESEGRV
jgi:hypothetical protein